MGVLACDRPNCDNIMCDVYVPGAGYICYECEKEFKVYLDKHGINPKTEEEILGALKMFMTTVKDEFLTGSEMELDEFFNQHRRE